MLMISTLMRKFSEKILCPGDWVDEWRKLDQILIDSLDSRKKEFGKILNFEYLKFLIMVSESY